VAEYPACHICGEQTKPSSGSNLGATWDCPNGHYREVLSKNEGRYYLSNGERHSIDQAPDAEFGAALLKLKE
jgi:transposase